MKTIVEREVIPPDPEPTVIETTWYVCENSGCDFRSQDEDEMRQHHGKTHAVRDQLDVGDLVALRFDTEQDADAYGESYGADRHTVRWTGPGWYTARSKNEPCGRGCCSVWAMYLVPIETELDRIRDEGRAKLRTFLGMRRAIQERENAHG